MDVCIKQPPQFLPELATPSRLNWNSFREPRIFRGLAADWPAVRHWTFSYLTGKVPDSTVELVVGNRELGATRFVSESLHRYFQVLSSPATAPELTPCLKEFDLLRAAPALSRDLWHHHLLSPWTPRSVRSWIGPTGATTGLHYDYLDNVAVQILGKKRWYLARPGALEKRGGVATKYDRWARLASMTIDDLLRHSDATGDVFVVDSEPGDVLFVPAGWWHQVTNQAPSILFGGFFGSPLSMLARSTWVGVRDTAHRLGWLAPGHCTCHE